MSEQLEPELIALIRKIERRLGFLEKKIDTLIEGSARKPYGDKRFSGSGRSEGNFRRPQREGGLRSHDRNLGGPRAFGDSRQGQRNLGGPRSFGDSRQGQRNLGGPRSFGESRARQGRGGGRKNKRPFRNGKDRH